MRHPVLIVLHQEHSTPGRLGYALQQLGYTLDVRRPRFVQVALLAGQVDSRHTALPDTCSFQRDYRCAYQVVPALASASGGVPVY